MAKSRNREKRKTASEARAGRGVKRHLRRLERLLVQAAKKESQRVRKLEKARWRRQRLEAEIEEVRTVAATATPAKAGPVKASATAKATPAKAAPAKAAPARAAAKPAPAKPAPAAMRKPPAGT
jgi:hypothetical protein